jgi:hypothetical protein
VLAAAREQWSDLGDDALHCLDPDLADPAWKAPLAGAGGGLALPYAPHRFQTRDGVVFTAADGMDNVVALSSTLRAIGSIEYFTRPLPSGGAARQPQPQLAKHSVPDASPGLPPHHLHGDVGNEPEPAPAAGWPSFSVC